MHRIKIITPDSIVKTLLSYLVSELSESAENVVLLDMVDRLVKTAPCYRLRCDMTDDSVLAAYHASK